MEIENEAAFDAACAVWLKKRCLPTEDLSKVMARAIEINGDRNIPWCPSIFERSYRELFQAGQVPLVTAGIPETPVRSRLTADEYNKMSIVSIRQKYAQDPAFRGDVDALLKSGKVA